MAAEYYSQNISVSKILVLVPAVKKNVAFPDDLIKKLAGIPLIQHTLNICYGLVGKEDVLVVTDSEEISLICERNQVGWIRDSSISLQGENLFSSLQPLVGKHTEGKDVVAIVSPYSPLLNARHLVQAMKAFMQSESSWLVPVAKSRVRPFSQGARCISQALYEHSGHEVTVQSNAFSLLKADLFGDKVLIKCEPATYLVEDEIKEIRSYEDWWICEKLLQRRRIVFRVIGDEIVGMGHIYRALALAHDISDHEIRFVCTEESSVAVNKIAGTEYWLGVYPEHDIVNEIVKLKPDLVINDILDTSMEDVCRLQAHGIKVVNFEDLGTGASVANLTVNELYHDSGALSGSILWGEDWLFLRDEFHAATRNEFSNSVHRVLLTFGGTDPSNYTKLVSNLIYDWCRENNVRLDIVIGEGYPYVKELTEWEASKELGVVQLILTTNAMSKLMENCDLAICSNGRSVYELAQMNVPSLVIPQHVREQSHSFACADNGFHVLDPERDLRENILDAFLKLVEDRSYRRSLFDRMTKYDFTLNKEKIIDRILKTLDGCDE